MKIDICADEARSSCGAHRRQGIRDVERKVVRHSAQEHDSSDQTQSHATQVEYYYAACLLQSGSAGGQSPMQRKGNGIVVYTSRSWKRRTALWASHVLINAQLES